MSDIIDLIEKIQKTGSSNEKKEIIRSGLSDENIRDTLHRTLVASLSDDIRYGVVIKEDLEHDDENGYDNTYDDVLNFIVDRRPFSTNEQKRFLCANIEAVEDENERALLVRVVNKDLNIGIGSTTVNKILKDFGLPLIRNLVPMKAMKEKPNENIFETIGGGLSSTVVYHFVQVKVDAARAFLVCNHTEGDYYFLSSTGKRIDCFDHITDLVIHKNPPSLENNFVIDGEMVAVNPDGSLMSRQKSNGLFNKAVKGTIGVDRFKFKFICWDVIDTSDNPEDILYDGMKRQSAYMSRFHDIKQIVANVHKNADDYLGGFPPIEVVRSSIAYSEDGIRNIARQYIEEGEEGAIVKTTRHRYEPKRSNHLVKIKKSYMADVRVVGLNEGKNEGTLGSLRYETDDGQVVGDVSGISDSDKEYWWTNPDEIIGSVIEVRYMELTTDERSGKVTLYGPPVFIRVRDDKNETSTLEELK